MKSGEVVRTFHLKDGQSIILRTLKWEDLEDCLEMINSLVDEKANILKDQIVTREEEIDWLARALSRMEKNEVVYIVAEVKGRMVANSEVCRHLGGYDKHVGSIGIAIRKGFRDLGIGTEMMKTLVEQAKVMGLKVLVLSAFANNQRAIHVYENSGVTTYGRVQSLHYNLHVLHKWRNRVQRLNRQSQGDCFWRFYKKWTSSCLRAACHRHNYPNRK